MKKEMPLVYIVLLNYNGVNDTIDCLKSLQNVNYAEMKTIVVDNASTDDSVAKLKSVQPEYDFLLLTGNENNGFSAGNNIGIKYAMKNNADYVLLLNNDTVVEPDFLSYAVEASEKDDNVGLTIGKILYYKEPELIWYGGGELQKPYFYAKHSGFRENKDAPEYNIQKYVTFATGCYFLLKRKTIESVGMLEEDYFMYCEDTDYCFRINKSNQKILYCPKSVIYHKIGASSGKGSDFSTYYIARNTIILLKRFLPFYRRLIPRLFWYYKMFRSSISGKLNTEAFWKGVRAGIKAESGKSDNL